MLLFCSSSCFSRTSVLLFHLHPPFFFLALHLLLLPSTLLPSSLPPLPLSFILTFPLLLPPSVSSLLLPPSVTMIFLLSSYSLTSLIDVRLEEVNAAIKVSCFFNSLHHIFISSRIQKSRPGLSRLTRPPYTAWVIFCWG